jgi:hypothetical protein
LQQDGRIGRRDLRESLEGELERRAISDDVVEGMATLDSLVREDSRRQVHD